MSLKDLARAEREELLHLLESLSPDEWQRQSLCTEWTVHDVVAHLLSYDELRLSQLARRFAKGRFRTDRVNAVGLADYRSRTPAQLIELLRRHLTPHGLPAFFGGATGLTDALIHQQDIRRPLNRPRTIAAERLVPALWTALFAPVVAGVVRARDVRLVATDLDWSFGRGPEVRATGEPLLMAVAGRKVGEDELSGPGAARLRARAGG